MVVVRVELWPGGNAAKATEIGRVVIANDGKSLKPNEGSYRVALAHGGMYWGRSGSWLGGTIKRHQRDRSPYHLVLAAIRAALGGRRGENGDLVDVSRKREAELHKMVEEFVQSNFKKPAPPADKPRRRLVRRKS